MIQDKVMAAEYKAMHNRTAAFIEAEELVASNMDLFSDWLASECIGKPTEHCRIDYIPRSEASFANFIESLDAAQAMALTMHPNAKASHAAAQRLRDLYMEAQAEYIVRIAGQLEGEMS
jgi:hypothetical protein